MSEQDFTSWFYSQPHRRKYSNDSSVYLAAKEAWDQLQAENSKLKTLINTPVVDDFLAAIPLEAAHQQQRWGVDHDAGKTPFDWVFLIGHLATRAASKMQEGDMDKALHHTITTAAVCLNWHRHMTGELTRFQPADGSLLEENTGGEKK